MISSQKSPLTSKNRMSTSNTMGVRRPNDLDNDNVMTTKKLKSKTMDTLENSMSSITSKSKKERKTTGVKGKTIDPLQNSLSSISSKSKKDKKATVDKEKKLKKKSAGSSSNERNAMDALHASYGSLGTGSFSSLVNLDSDSDDEEFATPRQSLTSPSNDNSWKNGKSKKVSHDSQVQREIMAPPVSPNRPVPPKNLRIDVTDSTSKKASKTSSASFNDSSSNLLNQSISEFGTPRQSPWRGRNQSKKTIVPNPKDPKHIKTIFLQDCSDSSDSDHEIERKKRKATKAEKPKAAITTDALDKGKKPSRRSSIGCEPSLQSKDTSIQVSPRVKSKINRRASIGPATVPTKVPVKDEVLMPSKTKSKQRPTYGKQHHRAATQIAAVVRGYLGRLETKIRQLQQQLEKMEHHTMDDIAEIYVELEISKQEWEEKALGRFQKNLQRSDRSLNVHEAQDLIHKIRAENTDFRERNQLLFADLQKLKINNERLEAANKASSDFMDRIAYHEDTCTAEHTKLTKIHIQYENAVKEHEKHLALHVAHGDCENKAKRMYSQLLSSILDFMDSYKQIDPQLVEDIYEMANVLESEYGKIERNSFKDSSGSKDSKKSKKKDKKTKK